MKEIKVIKDTVLKPSPAQSSTLPPDELAPVKAGTIFPILAYLQEADHLKFTIDPNSYDLKSLHHSAKNTWYAYLPHLEDEEGVGPNNNPSDVSPEPPKAKGLPFRLAGNQSVFYSGNPICPQSPNFTWAEALHFNGNDFRNPASPSVVLNIIKISKVLQQIRNRYNKPVKVTSWYRDPVTNRRVGGASQSRHMVGDAVDFYIPGIPLNQLYKELDTWWGSKGGLAVSYKANFIHIDGRNYKARWRY